MWKTPTVLFVIVLVLLALGIVMLASTSDVRARDLYNDSCYFIKRQVIWMFVALAFGFVASRIDYHYWRKLAFPVYLLSLVALVLVFVPSVGVMVGGSRRWLRFHGFSMQSSEIAKFAMILFLSWWMSRERRSMGEFRRGFLVPFVCMGFILALIFLEPDFGTTLLCGAVGMAMLLAGGTRLAYLVISGILGLVGFSFMVMQDPVRQRRILAFLDPAKYADREGYHLINSIEAFVQGGLWGVGLGQSMQKQFYLPEAHTDFIFAIIAEELGLLASLGVVLLFAGLFACGMLISFRASDLFGRLLAFGLTILITLQAAINMGVVTGCLPTKGLPLPFISFGGSSLVMSMFIVGVLVNIAQHAGGQIKDEETTPIKDRFHRF